MASDDGSKLPGHLGQWLEGLGDVLGADDEYRATGWVLLDKFLVAADIDEDDSDGMFENDVGIIAPAMVTMGAQPKAGKSIWSQIVATNRVNAGDWVLYIDLENGHKRFLRRLMCRQAQVGKHAIKRYYRGCAKPEVVARMDAAILWLKGVADRFVLHTQSDISAHDIRAYCDMMRSADPERNIFIVVDSLQRLPTSDSHDRRSGVEQWMQSLQDIRNDYDAVVLIVSELKRATNGTSYVVGDALFKESGRIEYASDISLAIDGDGVLTVRYNRDGDVGTVAKYEKIKPYFGMKEVPVTLDDAGNVIGGGEGTGGGNDNGLSEQEAYALHAALVPGNWYPIAELAMRWKFGNDLERAKTMAAGCQKHGLMIARDKKGLSWSPIKVVTKKD